MELEIGATVGDYRVIGVVGSGGTGKVYKVQNVITERFEAMKVLLPDLANEPKLAERFMREIRVHSGLEHPNIASFRTALRVGNQLLLVMELVEGITLLDKLEGGPLVPATAIDYTTQVLSALECAHSQGVIHRDVKLSNMMLTPAGVVKLLDFGIAKGITDHGLTLNDTTLGSPYYIAPEQIQGAATVDERADLYSAGISLYEMVTGKKPFDGPDRFSIMLAHVKEMPVPPLEVNRQLPKALSDLILKAVAKSPDGRFQTAAAFHEALSEVAGAMPPTAQPVAVLPLPTPARAPGGARQARRWRGVGMGLGAVTMAAAAIAITQLDPWPIQLSSWRIQLGSWPMQLGPWRRTQPAPLTPLVEKPVPSVASPPSAPTPHPAGSVEIAVGSKPVPKTAPKRIVLPVQSTPAVAAQPAPLEAPPPAVHRPPPSPPARGAEFDQTREQLILLGLRSDAIHARLRTLERAQAARGLYLASDMVEAESLMDNYLDEANTAFNTRDAASAKSFVEKAQLQVERLEELLNQ